MKTSKTTTEVAMEPVSDHRSTLYMMLHYKGRVFCNWGKIGFLNSDKYCVAYLTDSKGATIVLDQRTKILVGSEVVFDPEINKDHLFPDIKKWIDQNPEWRSVIDSESLKNFKKNSRCQQ